MMLAEIRKLHLVAMIFVCHCGAATTYNSDGTRADTQSKIDGASDGDTVVLPAGAFSWTSGITISGKGIKLQGGGSGRIIARSADAVAVGTGAKSFTTQSGLSISAGQTLLITETGTRANYMLGTVTSYSGTALVMSIASTGGSGAPKRWIISTLPTTTIERNAGDAALMVVIEDTTHSVEITGIQFAQGGTASDTPGECIQMVGASGKPILIHDCWFQMWGYGTLSGFSITSDVNRGIVWNCSFDFSPFAEGPSAISVENESVVTPWTTTSFFGMNDTGGTNNFYIEDCDFHCAREMSDFSGGCRAVMRHCVLNNITVGTHGADTGPVGLRYFECYDSEFVWNGYSDGSSFPLNWWFFLRGGTAVITDNILPDLISTDYGDKTEVVATVMQLQRNAGPNPCWGANIGGIQYPCPRQVGMGRVTGAAGNDSVTYTGDVEPLYIWNNSRTPVFGTTDYGTAECTSPDSSSSYIVSGRDYFNDGTAKPGYVKFTYPHPLRTDLAAQGVPSRTTRGGFVTSGGRISR